MFGMEKMTQSHETQQNRLQKQLNAKQVAYQNLATGSATLLGTETLFWTERLMLHLTHWVAQPRLAQLAEVLGGE